MKSVLMILAVLASTTANAHVRQKALEAQWTCDSTTFPKTLEIKVNFANGRITGYLTQVHYSNKTYYTHDGDLHHKVKASGSDLVELKLVADDKDGLRFEQVATNDDLKVVAGGGYFGPLTNNTQGTVLEISNVPKNNGTYKGFKGRVSAAIAPIGKADRDSSLVCW